MSNMKIKFKKAAELIEHEDFSYLYQDCIEIGNITYKRHWLGSEVSGLYDGEIIIIEDYSYDLEDLEGIADFTLPEIIDVDGDTMTFDGKDFYVGCKTIPKKEMVKIVNYVLGQLGYDGI